MTGVIIAAAVMFFSMVAFHEFGHFAMAKFLGVKVNEFAVGFGPKLLKWHKGETDYSIRIFPLGGFCRMEGEDNESDEERGFNNAPLANKLLILVAGPFMNVFIAAVMMAVAYLCEGVDLLVSIRAAFAACGYYVAVVFDSLKMIFAGLVKSDDVVGVVGMAGMVKEQAQYGLMNMVFFMSMISVNLGVMNLLPVPGLDGGRIVISVLRKIFGEAFTEDMEAIINLIGLFILFGLMIWLTVKDTFNLFR